jgi:hypothetical protein
MPPRGTMDEVSSYVRLDLRRRVFHSSPTLGPSFAGSIYVCRLISVLLNGLLASAGAASGGRTLSRAGFDSRPPTVYLFFVCFSRPTDRLPRAMRLTNRKRRPKPDRRRALELLASCRDGCTEALMLAHGFTVAQMAELVRAGLASATAERMVAGNKTMEIARVRITEAGRRALDGALS